MGWRMLQAVLLLPGTVLIVVPVGLHLLTRATPLAAQPAAPDQAAFWIALVLAGAGLALAAWTATLFVTLGGGTPAPWDPPARLVIRGPYRHVRNPMISGVGLVLLAEALLLQSWPIAIWLALFLVGNAAWFPLVEEPGLERRFGSAYTEYRRHVPRWIPRLRPWRPPAGRGGDDA